MFHQVGRTILSPDGQNLLELHQEVLSLFTVGRCAQARERIQLKVVPYPAAEISVRQALDIQKVFFVRGGLSVFLGFSNGLPELLSQGGSIPLLCRGGRDPFLVAPPVVLTEVGDPPRGHGGLRRLCAQRYVVPELGALL